MINNSVATSKLSIIIPAFNEELVIETIIKRIQQVLQDYNYEIIVANDGSQDNTVALAQQAGARVINHPYNKGNGAAIKSGMRQAKGEIFITMDADGQHKPEDIPRLLEHLGPYDMVVGARSKESETSIHRDIANSVYNNFASYMCERKIEDLTSGFRAIKADVARKFIYLLPNTFSYPTTLTLAIVRSGHSLLYVPIIAPKRVGKSKIKLLRDGSRFFIIILKVATLFSPLKVFLPVSIAMFGTGFGYGLFKVIVWDVRYGPTSAMLMTMAIVVFMVGLVSEQIAQLRFDRSED